MKEVFIYGYIDSWEVSAKSVIEQLTGISIGEDIHVRINSYGGDILSETPAIISALNSKKNKKYAYIDGVCASAATIIALDCEKIYMSEGAYFMIHEPTLWGGGTVEEIQRSAEMLSKMRDQMVAKYVAKSGQSEEKIREMMKNETWMTAQEALEMGFIDEITSNLAMAASYDPEKSNYKNPKIIQAQTNKKNTVMDIKEQLANLKNEVVAELKALFVKAEVKPTDEQELTDLKSIQAKVAETKKIIEDKDAKITELTAKADELVIVKAELADKVAELEVIKGAAGADDKGGDAGAGDNNGGTGKETPPNEASVIASNARKQFGKKRWENN